MTVILEAVEAIPRAANGKFRAVISRIGGLSTWSNPAATDRRFT
jgi:hypothetical protein